jgi:hypothetical protein
VFLHLLFGTTSISLSLVPLWACQIIPDYRKDENHHAQEAGAETGPTAKAGRRSVSLERSNGT